MDLWQLSKILFVASIQKVGFSRALPTIWKCNFKLHYGHEQCRNSCMTEKQLFGVVTRNNFEITSYFRRVIQVSNKSSLNEG